MAADNAREAPVVTASQEQDGMSFVDQLWSTYEGLRAQHKVLAAQTDQAWSVYEGLRAGPESSAAWAAYEELSQRERSCWDELRAASLAFNRAWDAATPDE